MKVRDKKNWNVFIVDVIISTDIFLWSFLTHHTIRGFHLFVACLDALATKCYIFFRAQLEEIVKKFPGPIQNFLHIWADDDVADR